MLKQLDVLGLRVWLEKKTRFGRKAHPRDEWGFTRQYLATYAEEADANYIIEVLKAQGIPNDIECGRWLLQHDAIIP